MNVTCWIDQHGRGTRVARGGAPMNRAVGARLYFLAPVPGASPGRRPRLVWADALGVTVRSTANVQTPEPGILPGG